jgi:hypothetical protein
MHRCDYQDQDTRMTLREGLAEYYRTNPGITPPAQASADGAVFFASHDVVHVVFGTTTEILDEGVTDMWQMLGLDISAWTYIRQGLSTPEVRDIVRQIGVRGTLSAVAMFPRIVPKVWRRARRMTKPWPWKGFEAYLDVRLGELREEFGIEVLDGRG